ncbi:helix-turn-helix transcriptional regulator [uncultured Victivallis sp.]|uniref:helix-turn-helix domain-containing protein n=1 Tax=uncultured Victivallis sp. TaxID=354118 RepID=UPI0025955A33|nr:helix-turn-helix transcriptional regulator [uncultured Victivallis sp.]
MLSMENIAEQLKALRQQYGWSQEDLARELGVSFSTVNRWENGKAKPSRLAQKGILALTTQAESSCHAVDGGNS